MSEKLWQEASIFDLVMVRLEYDSIYSDEIVNIVKQKGVVDSEDILNMCLGVAARIIFSESAVVGQEGSVFLPWPGTPAEVVERVAREWMSLGRIDADYYFTFWMDATKKGREYGAQVLERLGPWLDDAPDPPSSTK